VSAERRHPVLLCDDGSEGAREAIAVAGQLLAGRDAVVLTIVESLSSAVFHGVGGDATIPSGEGEVPLHVDSVEAARRLASEGVEAARTAGFDATPLVDVTPGATALRIVTIADEYDASAIVLGARGLSKLKSIVLGSVSHEVVQYSKRPVLVVHRTEKA
jgi:nucleotide-binding universal stress UspA family protein